MVEKLLARIYGKSGIVYILGVENKHNAEEIVNAIVAIAPTSKEYIMTAAQQLISKGMQQEKLGIAKNMLFQLHLGLDIIGYRTL